MSATLTDVRSTTRERILDAMFDAVLDFGLTRTTIEDVAQRAGLSRQTVYRYFPSKDHLVLALVLREEEAFISGAREAFERGDDFERSIENAVGFTLRFAHEHPLLDRLLATDAETFLPYLTTRGLGVITRARDSIVDVVRERRPDLDEDVLRGLFDLTTRATISYILTPSERTPDAIAHTLARTVCAAIDTQEGPER